MLKRLLLTALTLLSLAAPALAQPRPRPSAELGAGAGRVIALLKGEAAPADIFTPAFLAQVPDAQVRTVVQQLTSQYGAVRGLAGIDPATPQTGTIHIAFERATLHMSLAVDPQPPHRISGLLLTGTDMTSDSFEALAAEIRALPGRTTFAVARLGGAAPALTASLEPDRPLAIGSAFKLFILAELNRQVRAGQRRWSDVVALDRRSIPGGTLSAWPAGSPLTLHTLAALMISSSDNSATDMLLHTLGRANVERMMATVGVRDPARNRPLLSTLEATAIKTAPAAALNAWSQADEAGRRRMLASDYANVDASRIDVARFAGNPMAIESVEWFASAADMVRVMDWLRINADDTARAVLAINPGVQRRPPELAYLGYKGGSEPGVISLTWLVRTRADGWYAVSGVWNNPAAPVEELRFLGLMTRALQLLR